MIGIDSRYVVVGAGLFGSVIAERIATELNERVTVLERRSHPGGNCHSFVDPSTGIECHAYGSHIFHTSSERVWRYLRNFTDFNTYQHKVLTRHRERVYPMPVSLATINAFFDRSFSPAEAAAFVRNEIAREVYVQPANLEEKAVSLVGRRLYEAFIHGYTAKHWGIDPRYLPASIITRLPVRFNYNANYFDDPWQGIPLDGYARLFERMLDHPRITVRLGTDFFDVRSSIDPSAMVIYSGPIDRYFNYRHGRLGWLTLDFKSETVACDDFQGTAVMNYADADVPYTRIHEFRHYHPERAVRAGATCITYEYSRAASGEDERCYPVPTAENLGRFERYRQEAADEPNTIFGGRLGSYRYLDMDKVIDSALTVFDERLRRP